MSDFSRAKFSNNSFSFLFDTSEDEEVADENGKVKTQRKSRRRRQRERISAQLAEVASSYGLVRFQPLVVTDERLIKVSEISGLWLNFPLLECYISS